MEKEVNVYIVAGDEMQKLFGKSFPEYETIPFRDDLSKGSCEGFCFNETFLADRASYWGVSKEDYLVTGLIVFFVFGVVAFGIVARNRKNRR